jgi:mannosyltransferase
MKRAVLCCVILLGAFALRINALGGQSLWYDEAVTARVAGQGLAELTRWTAEDIQPPLYYYLVAGWTRMAGNTEWALRFPSAFFGTLTVALAWSVARRLLGGRPAFLAAVLTASSALHVYYAQEARMYALLTFLGLLGGYVLLRAWGAPRRSVAQWWGAFVLAAAAALYTHYFAGFLLGAYALVALLAWLVEWRAADTAARGGLLRKAGYASGSLAAAALLFAPWLPAMLNRYRVDASYWQGALKLGEAVRHVAISFVAGAPQAMLEADGVRWSLLVATALLLGVAVLSLTRGKPLASRIGVWPALLIVLIAPVVAVLVLASRTPKFNPRYLMLASPAYLLLVAGLTGALWGRGRAARWVAAGMLAVVMAPGALGIWNWFNVPLFTKAQWREAAGYVESAISGDEAVVLVSGHAEPAWSYYAPRLEPVRLPSTEILDVTAVLGFDAGEQLQRGLAGKGGAWLVMWQDDVVDPLGVVPFLLRAAGGVKPATPHGEPQFWHVGVQHWRLPPGVQIPAEPRPEHSRQVNFDHKLALLGWDDPVEGLLTVYWDTLNTLTEDYQVSLVLEDATGAEMGRWDGRPAAYGYPTQRWQVGETVFGRYPLPIPAQAGATPYSATIAVYSTGSPAGLDIRDVADNPAGKRARLGPFAAVQSGRK